MIYISLLLFLFAALGLIALGLVTAAGKEAPKPDAILPTLKTLAELQTIMPIPEDPSDDGIEVIVIRSESMYAHGGSLFWRDPATNKVLDRPMGIYEIMDQRA